MASLFSLSGITITRTSLKNSACKHEDFLADAEINIPKLSSEF